MDVIESIKKQFKEEVGDQELTKEETLMLQQKFGLVAPVLTQSERNLVSKYER